MKSSTPTQNKVGTIQLCQVFAASLQLKKDGTFSLASKRNLESKIETQGHLRVIVNVTGGSFTRVGMLFLITP